MRLNKQNSGRKVIKLSALFVLGLALTVSCKKKEVQIGQNLIDPNNQLGLFQSDTFSVLTYSVYDDSVRSDEVTQSLLGSYNDPEAGHIQWNMISQFSLEADNPSFGNFADITMDSLVLYLAINSVYGDLDAQTFEVYRLNEDLDKEASYYNFSQFDSIPGNLVVGNATVTPNPYSADSVYHESSGSWVQYLPHLKLVLDPLLGQEILNESQNGTLIDNVTFMNYFKGLIIRPNTPNQASGKGGILAINPYSNNSKITMYYNELGVHREFDFRIDPSNARVNRLEMDYSGSNLGNAMADTTLGMNEFYIYPGRIRGAVQFPNLMSLNDSVNGGIINRAILSLPVQKFIGDNYGLISKVLSIIKTTDGNENFIPDDLQYGTYNGFYDSESKEYKLNITRYLQQVLNGEYPNTGLELVGYSNFSSAERLVFSGAESFNKNKARLEITYSKY